MAQAVPATAAPLWPRQIRRRKLRYDSTASALGAQTSLARFYERSLSRLAKRTGELPGRIAA